MAYPYATTITVNRKKINGLSRLIAGPAYTAKADVPYIGISKEESDMHNVIVLALMATLGTWFVTALGAGTVILFSKEKMNVLNPIMGFAAGVMIAASFWSLLQPAIERAQLSGDSMPWLVVAIGFLSGAGFIWLSDKFINYIQKGQAASSKAVGSDAARRIFMLVLAITLHNIPEGLAVGVAFGALNGANMTPEGLMAAISLAIGIALQNFPEGAAVSLPLRREGYSRMRSFLLGQASGIVEPIAGVIGALLVVYIEALLPLALSFAAGAMIIVTVHELIPESQSNRHEHPYAATIAIIFGFTLMMMLDVALG